MIGLSLIIALIQVFFVQQSGGFGALPMLWLIAIIMMRTQCSWHQLLAGGAVYSFMVTSLSQANPLWHLATVLTATAAALATVAWFDARAEYWRLRWSGVAVATFVYSAVWILMLALPVLPQVRFATLILVAVASWAVNLLIIGAGSLIARRLHA